MLQMINTPTSSNTSRFAWSEDTLYVEFKRNRQVYRYLGVPFSVYKDMLIAQSPGSYLASAVKPHFRCELLPEQEARALGFEAAMTA